MADVPLPTDPLADSVSLDSQNITLDVALAKSGSLTTFTHTTSSTGEEQLAANPVPSEGSVTVIAAPGNTGTVYVGGQGSQDVPLPPGQDFGDVPVDDTSDLYVNADNSGDAVIVAYTS